MQSQGHFPSAVSMFSAIKNLSSNSMDTFSQSRSVEIKLVELNGSGQCMAKGQFKRRLVGDVAVTYSIWVHLG